MENSSSILRAACFAVLALGSCAFAYSLGWQHGEASGSQSTTMRLNSIAASVRANQVEWEPDVDVQTGGEVCQPPMVPAVSGVEPRAVVDAGGN